MRTLAKILDFLLELVEDNINDNDNEYYSLEHQEYWENINRWWDVSGLKMFVSILLGVVIAKMIELLVCHIKNRKTHFVYIPYILHHATLFILALITIMRSDITYNQSNLVLIITWMVQDLYIVFMILLFLPNISEGEYFCQKDYYMKTMKSWLPLFMVNQWFLNSVAIVLEGMFFDGRSFGSFFTNFLDMPLVFTAPLIFALPLLIWKNNKYAYIYQIGWLTFGFFPQETLVFINWLQGKNYWEL